MFSAKRMLDLLNVAVQEAPGFSSGLLSTYSLCALCMGVQILCIKYDSQEIKEPATVRQQLILTEISANIMKHLSYFHDLGTSLVTFDKHGALMLILACHQLLSWLSRTSVCRMPVMVMSMYIEASTILQVKEKSIFYGSSQRIVILRF